MRARPVPILAAVFVAAAAAAAFVVTQLPREGALSRTAPVPSAAPGEKSPPIEPPATAADGEIEVHATAGGEPQLGADVAVYLAPDAAAGWRRAGEARTGPGGLARVPARPGAYLVVVRAPGLAPGRTELVRTQGEGPSRAEVELEPAAAVRGRARTPGGAPVAGARVRAVPIVSRWPGFDQPSAPPEETGVTATDAAGAFQLEGLSPGSWAVTVDAPGTHPVSLPRVPVPGEPLDVTLEPLGAVEGIVLQPDGRPAAGALVRGASADHGAEDRAGADGRFRLAAPPGSYVVQASLGEGFAATAGSMSLAAGETVRDTVVRLGPAATVSGEVVRRDGAPASGAEVALFLHRTREIAARAVAAADGRFTVRGLSPGAYDIRAIAPRASPARLEGVTLAAGATFPLRIALPGTGTVEGTVRDPRGRPLAGVRVRAVYRGEPLVPARPVEARTDFEGRFRLEAVDVGSAEIVARVEGVHLGWTQAVHVPEGREIRADLVLPDAGAIGGRVRVESRAPPPGTTVVAVALRGGIGSLQVARAPTDANGNYQLALPAGDYRVHAAPGQAGPDLRATPAFVRVEPRIIARLDIALAPPRPEESVEIVVLEPGGAPAPGAIVTLGRPDDGRIALATAAGDDGRVAIAGAMGLAGQRVAIRARSGGRTGSTTVVMPTTGTIRVPLSPSASVEGVVRGARVSGFTLEISSQPAAGGWRTLDVHRFTGDRFELGDLPSEPLRLAVRADDGRRGAAEVRLDPGERRVVVIALR
jgi:hypothetical protein